MPHDTPHNLMITMVAAVSAGVLLLVVARRLNIPGIVLLLLGGMALGPRGLEIVHPDSLQEDGLRVLVSLAVGLILFEGGLTLDLSGFRSAPAMIRRLLSVGVLITWLCTAAALRFIMGMDLDLAIVAGSLVIVTGPTVIAPLLKRVRVTPRLHNVLHWEGVLIDPIGVFIAILCFEWITGSGGQAVLANLGLRFAVGLSFGVIGGVLMILCLRKRLVPDDMANIFALAMALVTFGTAELLVSEAGLLSVTVAGFLLGLNKPTQLRELRQFKAEVTDLLIGTLFILLSARLGFDQFKTFGLAGAGVVAVVIVVIRPLSIMICSRGLNLNWREQAFLSWIAPRGIVAASMASLVALSLPEERNPLLIETFVYSVIISTILLQGLTAGPVASLLRVRAPDPTGWLIVGSNRFSRDVAKFIHAQTGVGVMLVDTNRRAVSDAQVEGLSAMYGDARDTTLLERTGIAGIGYLLALTDNEDLNARLGAVWSKVLGRDRVYRWSSAVLDSENNTTGEGSARDGETGRPVWSNLPKPQLLSAEMSRMEARTVTVETEEIESGAWSGTVIIRVNSKSRIEIVEPVAIGKTSAAPEDERGDEDDGAQALLCLQRQGDYLMRALRPDLAVRLHVHDVASLFADLVERFVKQVPAIPKEDLLSELTERERVFPTALGHGVAVPHAYCRTLEARMCAVAQIPSGISFGAPDGQPVRLVFMVISPAGDPEGHLATLAEIARLVADEGTRMKLLNASDPAQLLRVIHAGRTVQLVQHKPSPRSAS
ncbi:MAG: PTS transporter subunit EIIA [Planctomycetes bacterium]|nr:PTS transporter subunit EIIA [Planctomycetota bacterium]